MESEPQQAFETSAEQRGSTSATGDDDPFYEAPPTDIESLRGRLMDSGLFTFHFNIRCRH